MTALTNPLDHDAYPARDEEIPAFLAGLGLDGITDIHVHGLPDRLQQAVWRFFDALTEPPWPILYRQDEVARLAHLRNIGITRHTALAYGHKPGVAAWCNTHTLGLAAEHAQVVPTFTFFAEDGVEDVVQHALDAGGRVAKIHLQVSHLDPMDPRLQPVWAELARLQVVVVLHAAAVYGVAGGEAWCGPDPVRRLLEAHPDLVLVIAHLGAPDLHPFLDLARQGAVWLDQSMVLMDPPYIAQLDHEDVDRVAEVADRILFGTDYPSLPHPVAAQLRGLAPLRLDRAGLGELLRHRADRLLAAARPDLA